MRTVLTSHNIIAMAEDDTDRVVSLQDVLEENRQLEETANAVLGPSDDSSCTYTKVGATPHRPSLNLDTPIS